MTTSDSTRSLQARKDHHIDLCLQDEVEFYDSRKSGFESWRFDHDALPEIDFDEIDTSVEILGKKLSAPLIIGAMTGGTERAGGINRALALGAQNQGIALALGSQRPLLKALNITSQNDPSMQAIRDSYFVKDFAPNLPLLFGNLGAVQLNYGVGLDDLKRLVAQSKIDALNLHLNPLQEVIQPEGDRNFKDLIPKIRGVIQTLTIPVLLKEVGSGISETTALKMAELPNLAGIETAGVGGTSWAKIEGLRRKDSSTLDLGTLFAKWGIPTCESIQVLRKQFPAKTIVASGGIRNGIEWAKSLALGADAVAMALPFLRAAKDGSSEAVEIKINQLIHELKVVMFIVGARNISALKTKSLRRALDFTSAF